MSRRPDPVKREQWAERFQRFDLSRQTVAQFCQAEGVAVAAYYHWKRRLMGGAGQDAPLDGQPTVAESQPRKPLPGAFKPVWLAGPVSSPAGATIRLPSGIVVELGHDPRMIQQVIRQLLDDQARGRR